LAVRLCVDDADDLSGSSDLDGQVRGVGQGFIGKYPIERIALSLTLIRGLVRMGLARIEVERGRSQFRLDRLKRIETGHQMFQSLALGVREILKHECAKRLGSSPAAEGTVVDHRQGMGTDDVILVEPGVVTDVAFGIGSKVPEEGALTGWDGVVGHGVVGGESRVRQAWRSIVTGVFQFDGMNGFGKNHTHGNHRDHLQGNHDDSSEYS
jgi:hypothetical protein